jgi:hypothetical protein
MSNKNVANISSFTVAKANKKNSFSYSRGEVSNLKASFKKQPVTIFHLNSHEIAADGKATEFFSS